jgi:hypothetical protein
MDNLPKRAHLPGIPNPEIYAAYHNVVGQRSQTLTAFLGGITFGAATFIMQAPAEFEFIPYYSNFLIVWLTLASMFFIFASAFYTIMALTLEQYAKGFKRPAILFTWLAFASLILLVPFLVRPFSYHGFLILLITVFVFGSIWLICHIVGVRRENSNPTQISQAVVNT